MDNIPYECKLKQMTEEELEKERINVGLDVYHTCYDAKRSQAAQKLCSESKQKIMCIINETDARKRNPGGLWKKLK